MQTVIKNEWIYEQSPKEVWEYLTQAELIALWLMPNDFKPIQGFEFQFRTKTIPSLDLDGIFYCKVLEIIPFQKLIYSWKGGPGNGIFTLNTIVEWTLEKYKDGTKLILNQSGFKDTNLAIFTAMTNGWATNIQKMVNYLNTKNNERTNP
jgi:uncharacterized protein YndB with AHSA1/START domain